MSDQSNSIFRLPTAIRLFARTFRNINTLIVDLSSHVDIIMAATQAIALKEKGNEYFKQRKMARRVLASVCVL